MAKADPDPDKQPLHVLNKRYRDDEKALHDQMSGAQRAAHRAIDIAFGRGMRGKGGEREQKPLRMEPTTLSGDADLVKEAKT